ncbi:MAG: preprotein translocase subunit SecG [Epsilonproteobacteria bacterium]|nr:MAG: preprotein translocase subunit SecG [Campylobacterota bacterium]RLA66433.1 MAG: preprotein translocase subunit SecG [Campylobacterota bacterium]
MIEALMIFQGVVSVLLIIMVLLQFGKGAEAGLISGGGSSDAVFSSAQQGNILSKITVVLAILFLGGSVNLARLQSKKSDKSLLDSEAPVAVPLSRDIEEPKK